jgi:hypothetical protein
MAFALNVTGQFEGEKAKEKEQAFLKEVRVLLKKHDMRNGNFYGDYIGHYSLYPYKKMKPVEAEPAEVVEPEPQVPSA